jgi:multimeric flavodoxin WrbA
VRLADGATVTVHGGPPTRCEEVDATMPRLLIVHHSPSPTTSEMLDAVLEGATHDAIEGVEVVTRAALTAPEVDVLEADGYVLGTPANIGYMSGALKHFFDRIYYPCLDETKGRPVGFYVHGNSDTDGAVRAIETVITGLEWKQAAEPVTVVGELTSEDREALVNLGGTVAATVAGAL